MSVNNKTDPIYRILVRISIVLFILFSSWLIWEHFVKRPPELKHYLTANTAFKDKNFVSINIQATSKSFFHDPKFFLDTSLGLPVISPQYTYSSNRKNIKANFLFDKSLFSNDKFDLAILLSDKKNSIEYKSSIKIENKSILFYTYQSYLYIFFISILGGLVLNFMPCVLPVLSIKLLSLISNREESLTLIRKSFVITSLGIISSTPR